MDFHDVLQQAIDSIPAKEWPTYDGKVLDRTEFLSSSEVGGCLRKAYFGKYPDKYKTRGFSNNGFAERGNAIEAWIVRLLKPLELEGYEFQYLGSEQRSFYNEDSGQSGTPDGLMKAPNGLFYGLEFKSIDPRANKSKLPKPQHVQQVMQNWQLMEHCLGIELEQFVLIYVDASNLFDTKVFQLDWNGKEAEALYSRADKFWNAEGPDDLEPEGVFTGDCDYCPFTASCSQFVELDKLLKEAETLATPFLEGVAETELEIEEAIAIDVWLESRDAIKQYTDNKNAVDAEVRQTILEKGGAIKYGGKVLTCKMVPGRNTMNKLLAQKDKVDLDKYYKRGAPYSLVKVLGDADE